MGRISGGRPVYQQRSGKEYRGPKAFPVKRQFLVGSQGIPLEEFLSTPVEDWMR